MIIKTKQSPQPLEAKLGGGAPAFGDFPIFFNKNTFIKTKYSTIFDSIGQGWGAESERREPHDR